MEKQEYIKRIKGFRLKHSMGQNFLIDNEVLDCITDFANKDDYAFEIGAGAGFLTEQLISRVKYLRALEIDKTVIPILRKNCLMAKISAKNECDFEIVEHDILKTNIAQFAPMGKKLKVFGNIPYCITSPIIAHLLGEIDDIENENRNCIDEIILMVQYEVAKRMVATNLSKNIKDYGMLSILSQFWADVELVRKVDKHSFYPSPRVDSAIVRLKINDCSREHINPLLRKVIKGAFSQRRKNIKNCLQSAGFLDVEKVLQACNIDCNLRAENLAISDFARLSEEFYEQN